MKEKILKLKSLGFSYSQIKGILGCSKGTISYHLNSETRRKTYERNKTNKNKKTTLEKKILYFSKKRHRGLKGELSEKIRNYSRPRAKEGHFIEGEYKVAFSSDDLIKKSGDTCYLTGKKLDLNNPSEYSIDHIIPVFLGGENTLENAGLTCIQANMAKGKMTLEEFKQLCLDVVNHFKLK